MHAGNVSSDFYIESDDIWFGFIKYTVDVS